MNKYFNEVTGLLTAIGGVLATLVGGYDIMFRTLLYLMVIDYFTGLIHHLVFKGEGFEWDTGFKGIVKKFLMMLLVTVCVQLETALGIPLRSFFLTFLLCNEGLSITKNVKDYITLPKKLEEVLNTVLENSERR